ncbi:MAG TPA: hypothetical protein VFA11_08185 [Acidimicrobiales bacterium]|nr:hypothetical protein [Acidimicrobiales bacterium]
MDAGPLRCPGCGGSLLLDHVGSLRRYDCEACAGAVMGVAVLRQVLAEGVAQRIWTAEETADARPPTCPFCSAAMRGRHIDVGSAAVCQPCEVVWLDQAALTHLPAAPTAAIGSTTHRVARCDNCGAPLGSTWDERCHYCGAAVAPVDASAVISLVPRG